MTAVVHRDLGEIPRGEWNALASRAVTGTVFQTYEWHRAWVHAFGAAEGLRIVSVHETGGAILLFLTQPGEPHRSGSPGDAGVPEARPEVSSPGRGERKSERGAIDGPGDDPGRQHGLQDSDLLYRALRANQTTGGGGLHGCSGLQPEFGKRNRTPRTGRSVRGQLALLSLPFRKGLNPARSKPPVLSHPVPERGRPCGEGCRSDASNPF